jgi:hypothetical protein
MEEMSQNESGSVCALELGNSEVLRYTHARTDTRTALIKITAEKHLCILSRCLVEDLVACFGPICTEIEHQLVLHILHIFPNSAMRRARLSAK